MRTAVTTSDNREVAAGQRVSKKSATRKTETADHARANVREKRTTQRKMHAKVAADAVFRVGSGISPVTGDKQPGPIRTVLPWSPFGKSPEKTRRTP